jgi:hypothetical protein
VRNPVSHLIDIQETISNSKYINWYYWHAHWIRIVSPNIISLQSWSHYFGVCQTNLNLHSLRSIGLVQVLIMNGTRYCSVSCSIKHADISTIGAPWQQRNTHRAKRDPWWIGSSITLIRGQHHPVTAKQNTSLVCPDNMH